MPGPWTPFAEMHSIEMAAVAFTLSEPLTEALWRRALRVAEPIARDSGLLNVVPSGPAGIPREIADEIIKALPQQALGYAFQRLDVEPPANTDSISSVREELIVNRDAIVFRTNEYVRWQDMHDQCRKIIHPILSQILVGANVGAVRIEYRDNFFNRTDTQTAAPDGLLRAGSPFVAPHVFGRDTLWHSHTGFFEPVDPDRQRLVQITLDARLARDVPPDRDRVITSIGIMTAVQDNIVGAATAESAEDPIQYAGDLIESLQNLHDRSISVFKELVSDEAAAEVGLMVQ